MALILVGGSTNQENRERNYMYYTANRLLYWFPYSTSETSSNNSNTPYTALTDMMECPALSHAGATRWKTGALEPRPTLPAATVRQVHPRSEVWCGWLYMCIFGICRLESWPYIWTYIWYVRREENRRLWNWIGKHKILSATPWSMNTHIQWSLKSC